MSGDGPYIMLIWILLAKFKVKPVICGGATTRSDWFACLETPQDSRAHRFHVQVGHVMLLAGTQAPHFLQQGGAAVEEVGQAHVDGFACNAKHASAAAAGCSRQPG